MPSYRHVISGAVSVVLAAFVVGVPANTEAQATLKCRPADDRTVSLIAQLKAWATTTDPETISERDNIFHVPVVDAKSLTVVTDEKLCAKVIAAYSAFPKLAYTPARLYVIKLGSKGYVGYDPDRKGGEFTAVHIFSTKFVRIGGWVG
jgi:hypothetical protein